MIFAGIEETVANYAHYYTLILYPAMFLHVQFDTYRQYLNSTGQGAIVLYAFSATTVCHIILCYLFVNILKLSPITIALSMAITCFGNLAFCAVYCNSAYPEHRIDPFGMFDLRLLKRAQVSEYLKVSLPATIMLCAEWWSYEFLILMAANLGTVAIGSMSIAYNYQLLLFMVPYGFQVGVTAVMGNAIGEENIRLAKLLNKIGLVLACSFTIMQAILSHRYSMSVARFYT
jgi:MATE family multidrug resistance protein